MKLKLLSLALSMCLLPDLVVCADPIEKHKLIIVGAGASGIAAATKLISNGFEDFIILEAENRIGGRVYNIPYAEPRGKETRNDGGKKRIRGETEDEGEVEDDEGEGEEGEEGGGGEGGEEEEDIRGKTEDEGEGEEKGEGRGGKGEEEGRREGEEGVGEEEEDIRERTENEEKEGGEGGEE
ncbi:hypothetical protein M8J76_011285 [Diaphorina citri]|nr:hypothetical protein M8J76_011285 [Diaphorina citri]